MTAANESVKGADLSKGFEMDMNWTEKTVPVELPGKNDIVDIPVVEGTDDPVLDVKYTPDADSSDETAAKLVIAAKPGDDKTYKINGEIVTEKGMTPTESDKAEVVESNDPLLTGLPFTLSVSKKDATVIGGVKASALQKDGVTVDFDKKSGTFKVKGELIYQSALSAYSANAKGYFVAFDVDWSKMPNGYEFNTSYFDASGKLAYKPMNGGNSATVKDTLVSKVADENGKKLDARGLQVINTMTNETKYYTLDYSGLTCPAPELIVFSDISTVGTGKTGYDKTAGTVYGEKLSNIQSGVTVTVDGNTVKLTGTLKPIVNPVTAWGNAWGNDLKTGYYVVFGMDASSAGSTEVKSVNPNVNSGAQLTLGTLDKDFMVARVAPATKDAETSNITYTATCGGKTVVYTLDVSGLTLEPFGAGDVKVKAKTGTLSSPYNIAASSFQKNLQLTLSGDTIKVTGELTPAKPAGGFGSGDMSTGYYVWFDIDASGIAGAKAWAVRGSAGGDCLTKPQDDFIFWLGKPDLKAEDIKPQKLYVLNTTTLDSGETGTGKPADGKVIKEYTLDFSKVTLVADPGAKPVSFNDQITGLGSSVRNTDRDKAALFYGTDIQKDITFTYDAATKTYTAAGTLNKVENWVGFSKSEPETRDGWFIALKFDKTYQDTDVTKVGKTETDLKTITSGDTCVIRVADKDGNAAAQTIYFQVGSGSPQTIKIDLSKLTLSETKADPTGEFVSLSDANITSTGGAGA